MSNIKKAFEDCRNPNKLYDYILERINEKEMFYIFIDEIQLCYRIKKERVDENSVPDEDKEYASFTYTSMWFPLTKAPMVLTSANVKV